MDKITVDKEIVKLSIDLMRDKRAGRFLLVKALFRVLTFQGGQGNDFFRLIQEKLINKKIHPLGVSDMLENNQLDVEHHIPSKIESLLRKGYKETAKKQTHIQGVKRYLEGATKKYLAINACIFILDKMNFPHSVIRNLHALYPSLSEQQIYDALMEVIDTWNNDFLDLFEKSLYDKLFEKTEMILQKAHHYDLILKEFDKHTHETLGEGITGEKIAFSKVRHQMRIIFINEQLPSVYRAYINNKLYRLCDNMIVSSYLSTSNEDIHNQGNNKGSHEQERKSLVSGSEELMIIVPEISEYYTLLLDQFGGLEQVKSIVRRQIKRYLYLAYTSSIPINFEKLDAYISAHYILPDNRDDLKDRSYEFGFVLPEQKSKQKLNNELIDVSTPNSISGGTKPTEMNEVVECKENIQVDDIITLFAETGMTIDNEKQFRKKRKGMLVGLANTDKIAYEFYIKIASNERISRPNGHRAIEVDKFGYFLRLVRRRNIVEFVGTHKQYNEKYTVEGENLYNIRK